MKTLPSALAVWDAPLSPFAGGLHGPLRDMAQRLAVLVGPLGAMPHDDALEPAGYRGLTRRGSFERLLPLEWMLAAEIPEEFLRRAVQGEQAFFELGREGATDPRGVVLLFDAGPESLGAPRIAHLALLVLFSRRAREAGTQLRWGALQALDAGVSEDVDEARLRALVQARSWTPPDGELLAQWAALPSVADARERFVVGPRSLVPLATQAGFRALTVDDEFGDGPRRLEVRSAARVSRAVTLDVPDGHVAARLLTQPWRGVDAITLRPGPARAARADLHPESELDIYRGRLFGRGPRGQLVVQPYAGGDASQRGAVLSVRDTERVVAFTHHKRRFTVLYELEGVLMIDGRRPTTTRDQVRLRQSGPHAPDSPDLTAIDQLLLEHALDPTLDRRVPFLNIGCGSSGTSVAFQVGSQLALVDFAKGQRLPSRVYRVGAAAGRKDVLRILERVPQDDGRWTVRHAVHGARGVTGTAARDLMDAEPFLGCSHGGSDILALPVGEEQTGTCWHVGFPNTLRPVIVPAGHTVVGAGVRARSPGLITRDAGGCALQFMGGDVPATLFISRSPIDYVRVSADDPHIVLRTRDRLVRVLDISGRELFVVEPEAAS